MMVGSSVGVGSELAEGRSPCRCFPEQISLWAAGLRHPDHHRSQDTGHLFTHFFLSLAQGFSW